MKQLLIGEAFVIEHIKGDVGLRHYAISKEKAVEKAEQHLRNNLRPGTGYEYHTMAIYPVTVVILAEEGETLEQRLEEL